MVVFGCFRLLLWYVVGFVKVLVVAFQNSFNEHFGYKKEKEGTIK